MHYPSELSQHVDRFFRKLSAGMHQKLAASDELCDAAIGGGLGAMTLLVIAEHEPLPIHELAEHLVRDKAQITRVLKLQDELGNLARAPACGDRRSCLVSLTEQGRLFAIKLAGALEEVTSDLTHDLTPAERIQLLQILRKVQ